MFILGFHFPATEGNDVAFDKVIEKLDTAVDTSGVSKIVLTYGKKFENTVEFSDVDSFVGKALIHYFNEDNAEKKEKYFIYTNRYQISEIAKTLTPDAETAKLCRLFDSMEQFKISVA